MHGVEVRQAVGIGRNLAGKGETGMNELILILIVVAVVGVCLGSLLFIEWFTKYDER